MKIDRYPFTSDEIFLSYWDIIKLLCGKTLSDPRIKVKLK
jgi:hypothetical protein